MVFLLVRTSGKRISCDILRTWYVLDGEVELAYLRPPLNEAAVEGLLLLEVTEALIIR